MSDKDPIAKRVEERPVRIDKQGRILCHARTHGTGDLCRAPAMVGTKVCRKHGGSAPQVKKKAQMRLSELVQPAIATLAREMTQAKNSSDRQRAANSLLDRAGISRVSTREVKSDDVKEALMERILQLQNEKSAQSVVEIEEARKALVEIDKTEEPVDAEIVE